MVGINNGELVIQVVTCMIMIRLYVPGFSKRCISCCWCIWNQMAGSIWRIQWRSRIMSGRVIFTFCQISDFLLQFYAFSKFSLVFKRPKSEETSFGDFSSITMCKSRFFPKKKKKKKKKKNKKKKNWFCALRRISVAIVAHLHLFILLFTLAGCFNFINTHIRCMHNSHVTRSGKLGYKSENKIWEIWKLPFL